MTATRSACTPTFFSALMAVLPLNLALPAQAEEVRADDDEPPYPPHGTGKLMLAARKALIKARGVGPALTGEVAMTVTIDASGKPERVAVLKSPDAQFTHWMALIVMTAEFTPARCHGSPCRMDDPFSFTQL